MLAPDARAVLLDELRPPAGHRLDAAVATTFTLDLAAALVPPLAFAAQYARDARDPIALMEAARSTVGRFDVFCAAGTVAVPSPVSDLMTFLEDAVHPVVAPRPGHLFHPKLWLLRYRQTDGTDDADDSDGTGDGGDRYRLLCLSRNLTLDNGWDLVVRLDAVRGTRPRAGNAPLHRLVRALPGIAVRPLPAERRDRITRLAEDARHLEWETPDDVVEVAFHAFGLPGPAAAPDFSGYRRLVVSPFLTPGGLDRVAGDWRDLTVVSRPQELDRLPADHADWFDPYVVSGLAGVEPEPAVTGAEASDGTAGREAGGAAPYGLHAKLYVVERDKRAHVLAGSANATDAAFGGNVEFLVELVGGASKLGVGTFLDAGAGFATLLEPYGPAYDAAPDPVEEERHRLDALVRDLAAFRYWIRVEPDEDKYLLGAGTDEPLPIPAGDVVRVGPLGRTDLAAPVPDGHSLAATYGPVDLADVNAYLVLTATSTGGLTARSVVVADLVGAPAERLDAVLARQIDSPEKFLAFLRLLLAFTTGVGRDPAEGTATEGTGRWRTATAGVFESVVRALASEPDAVRDADRLVQRMRATEEGRRNLPDGFEGFWSAVTAALGPAR